MKKKVTITIGYDIKEKGDKEKYSVYVKNGRKKIFTKSFDNKEDFRRKWRYIKDVAHAYFDEECTLEDFLSVIGK